MNIRGLRSNFVDCESFLESNSPDILALCEANLDDSIDSGSFSVRGYLPLIRKDSSTHMHGSTLNLRWHSANVVVVSLRFFLTTAKFCCRDNFDVTLVKIIVTPTNVFTLFQALSRRHSRSLKT